MARVTIEDCIDHIPNAFELVILGAQRVRQISAGAPLTVNRNNNKNPVVVLREIAENTVSAADLRESLIKIFRRHTQVEPEEEEFAELFAEKTVSERTAISSHGFHKDASDNLTSELSFKDQNDEDDEDDDDFSETDIEIEEHIDQSDNEKNI